MKAFRLTCILLSHTILTFNAIFAQDVGVDMDDLFEDDFEETTVKRINDPFEGFNRAIFNFNDGVYIHVAKPFVTGYKRVVPDPIERGISNFFDNLKYPSRLAGNLLQGKFRGAGQETGKFLVNTTAGLGGIFNAAKDMPALDPPKEDIAQAFASWGIGHGFYVVMPLLGPTSVRDFSGNIADSFAEPIPEPWSQIENNGDRLILRMVDNVNDLPDLIDLYDSMARSSIDKYAAVRDGYTQRRAKQAEE